MQRTSSRESLFSITSDAPCSETFYLGEQCKLADNRLGTVAFVGNTKFAPGIWVGLALDKPEGKNNGSVGGERYFECKEKHGVFCRPGKLTKLCPASPLSPSLSNGPPSPAASIARSVASTTAATNKTRSLYARECGFDIGERVSIGGGKVGVLRFLDRINNELFAGVQLDRPLGCCDGIFNNVRYFKCNPLYGIFVKAGAVKKCAKFTKPSTIEVRHTKTSTLRTWKGSQESLNSAGAGSICSSAMASPKFGTRFGASKGTISRNSEIEAGLKNCLQEKEAHLEHLSKELELRRAETDYLAQQNNEFTTRNKELEQLFVEAKNERADFERKFTELDERFEELTFQLDEAHVQKSMFEAEAIDLKAMCNELSEKLNANAPLSETEQVIEKLHRVETTEFGVQVELESVPLPVVVEEKCDFGTQTEALEEEKPNVKLGESQTDLISRTDFSSQCGAETSDANCEAFGSICNDVGFQTDACDKVYASSGAQTVEDEKRTFEMSASQTDEVKRAEINSSGMQTDPTERKSITTECGVQVCSSGQSVEVQTEIEKISPDTVMVEIGTQACEDAVSTEMQTEAELSPIIADFSSQTDSVPEKMVYSSEVQTEQKEAANTASQTDSDKPIEHCSREIQTEPEEPAPSSVTLDSMSQTDAPASQSTTECQTTPPVMSDISVQICPPPDPVKSVSMSEAQTTNVTICSSQVQTDSITPRNIDTAEFGAQVLLKSPYVNSEVQTMAPVKDEPPNNDNSGGIVELDVSKLVASSRASPILHNGGSTLAPEIEDMLKERNEKVEQLDSTVSFLNSIISEQTNTIGKLKKELESKKPSESNDETLVDRLSNGMKIATKNRVRAYCDFCQTFDVHETRDCPAEVERQTELNKHTTISPVLPQNAKRSKVVHRPFCDICEAFVHETTECPNFSPNTALTKW